MDVTSLVDRVRDELVSKGFVLVIGSRKVYRGFRVFRYNGGIYIRSNDLNSIDREKEIEFIHSIYTELSNSGLSDYIQFDRGSSGGGFSSIPKVQVLFKNLVTV